MVLCLVRLFVSRVGCLTTAPAILARGIGFAVVTGLFAVGALSNGFAQAPGTIPAVAGGGRNLTRAAATDMPSVDSSSGSQTGDWKWVAGNSTLENGQSPWAGVYGTQGTASATNLPGGRSAAATWVDAEGNMWLFGGLGADANGTFGFLNDLWSYNTSTGEWTWIGGSDAVPASNQGQPGTYGAMGSFAASSFPGAREWATTWVDLSGNLWLFGGVGFDGNGASGFLNDLWQFDPSKNQWAWMSGSELVPSAGEGQLGVYGTLGQFSAQSAPGGRELAAQWRDSSGNLWLFGGYGFDSTTGFYPLNDFWEFDPSISQWAWIGGSTQNSQAGTYGPIGSLLSGYIPGSRYGAASWVDSTTGWFWLYGGQGFDSQGYEGCLDDLWAFEPSRSRWVYVDGSDTLPSGSVIMGVYCSGDPSVYGDLGNSDAPAHPGGLSDGATWTDSNGNHWLFGGIGYDAPSGQTSASGGYLNDVWQMTFSLPEGRDVWTWMGGSDTLPAAFSGQPGVYGQLGVAGANNIPGGRQDAAAWADQNGHAWLFGGYGYDSSGNQGYLNDFWEYFAPQETAAATPTFSVSGGTYTSPQTVTIADTTPNAIIYYTTNGTTPTAISTAYTGPITVSSSETIKAIATASGYAASAVATAGFTIVPYTATPTFSPLAGTYTTTQMVTISDATPGASILYTTNGTTPTSSSAIQYKGPITVSSSETIKAVASAIFSSTSAVATAVYTIDIPVAATPTFSPVAGTYAAAKIVTISDSTSGATIYYTTNGSTPTTNSTLYGGPITISSSETIKAIATARGCTQSAVATAAYVIDVPIAANPTFSPSAGTYTSAKTVTLSDATPGATIYYTTNGSSPTTSSSVYRDPITISTDATIEAIATAAGHAPSAVAKAAYVIKLPATATPTFNPAPGNYAAAQIVTISDATAGAKIYYTRDGSTPTTASTAYTGAIVVSSLETINAIAVANGHSPSAARSAAYVIGKVERIITTVAGNGTGGYKGDGGAAKKAEVAAPNSVAVDGSGNLYFAESYSNVRKVSREGVISTVAGNGDAGCPGGSGPAIGPELEAPFGVAVDSIGNVYIGDGGGRCNQVRKVTPQGVISTVAGGGNTVCNNPTDILGDGCPANSATLHEPIDVAVDSSGNLYIADQGDCVIRKVNAMGIISTMAGNETCGYSGDGGAATKAKLNLPSGIAVDKSGNLYIADLYNNVVRKVTPAGVISTVAGNGNYGYSGNGGPATKATLVAPNSVAVDGMGNLYITDESINLIRMVTPAGIISTVAGTGMFGYSGDGGPAIDAELNYPSGLAADQSGNLYIADSSNNRVREVRFSSNGGSGMPGIKISINPVNFPTQPLNSTSAPRGIIITSTGNAPLTIGSISLSGEFKLLRESNSCPVPGTVAVGKTCDIWIAFAPTQSGNLTGLITINDNVTGSPQTIKLAGIGGSGNGRATAAPTISPDGGTFQEAQTVTLKDTTEEATIYYTTSGAPPTTGSTKYSKAFKVSSTTTVRAFAIAPKHAASTVVSAAFTISSSSPTVPHVAPGQTLDIAGSFNTAASITTTAVFSNNAGYTVSVLPNSVSSAAVSVLVPPYFNLQHGILTSGEVSVSVVQQPASGKATTSAAQDIEIEALPQTGVSPGLITLDVMTQLSQLVGVANQTWSTIANESGGVVNASQLNLPALQSSLIAAQADIQALVSGNVTQVSLGQIGGHSVFLDINSLSLMDQVFFAYYLGSKSAPAKVSVTFNRRVQGRIGSSHPRQADDTLAQFQTWLSHLVTSTLPQSIADNASFLRAVATSLTAIVILINAPAEAALTTAAVAGAVVWLATTWASAAIAEALEGAGSDILNQQPPNINSFSATIRIIVTAYWELLTDKLQGIIADLHGAAGQILKAIVQGVESIEQAANPGNQKGVTDQTEAAVDQGLFNKGAQPFNGTWSGSYSFPSEACPGQTQSGDLVFYITQSSPTSFSGAASLTGLKFFNTSDCSVIGTVDSSSGTVTGTVGANGALDATASFTLDVSSIPNPDNDSETFSLRGTLSDGTMSGPLYGGIFTLSLE